MAAGDSSGQCGRHGECPRPLPDVEPLLAVAEPQHVVVKAGLRGGGPGAQTELEISEVVGGDVHTEGEAGAGSVAPRDHAHPEHSPRLSLGVA